MNARYAGALVAAAVAATVVIATSQNAVEAGAFQEPDEVVAQYVAVAPTLDGVAESLWDNAPAIEVSVVGGANAGAHQVSIKSLYTDDSIYFLLQWDDPTLSLRRFPWVKQEDGTWVQLTDGSDHDETEFYEDKLAFIWNIDNSIAGFNQAGCMITCHAGEPNKAYGNKYTASPGEIGDIWHWKSVRSNPENYVDDQYVDDVRWSEDAPSAGRHSDPKDSGGYVNNKNDEGTLPAFMSPQGANGDYWIRDSEKVEFADTFEAGDEIAGIIVQRPTGDRGDIAGHGEYADGMWTLEIGRKLVTGSDKDVQFDDLGAAYYFGVAVFDNAQVRHAFQTGVSALRFAPKPTAVSQATWAQIKRSAGN